MVDKSYMNLSCNWILGLILVGLLPATELLCEQGLLRRTAIEPPRATLASLQQINEGDEIDREINRYFQRVMGNPEKDLDRRKLANLFGESKDEREQSSVQISLANRGRLDYMTSYRVKRGDTIWGIGRRMRIKPVLIVKHNPELKKRPLYIGEEILIVRKESARPVRSVRRSTTKYYKVRRGDSLSKIAHRQKVSVSNLRKWNHLKKKNLIMIGQRLKIVRHSKRLPRGYQYVASFHWPLRGVITSGFGRRRNPFTGRVGSNHKGLDIGASIGTPFRSARDGVVILSSRMGGYGNCIFIRHTNGFVTVYAHNKLNKVKVGDVVKKGQILGQVGRTGTATGPHLHFEVRKWKRPINPIAALGMRELVKKNRPVATRK